MLASYNFCQVSIHIYFIRVITLTGGVGEMILSILFCNKIGGNGRDFLFLLQIQVCKLYV
jgi:hypothetical protein